MRAQRAGNANFLGVVCAPLVLVLPASEGAGCGKPRRALSLNPGVGMASLWRVRVGGAGLGIGGSLSLPCGGAVPDAPAAGPGAQRHKAPLCG